LLPAWLAAFVLGDILVQQCEQLPAPVVMLAAALGGTLATLAVPALAGRRAARVAALLLACLGAIACGSAYGAWRAKVRLADTLAPADEGRDVRVRGVVASLPADFEGGTRFSFAVEQVLSQGPAVPGLVALSWHDPGRAVLPAQRWDLTVRLHRPHGNFNPGGFDSEAWMLEAGIRAQGTVRGGRHDEPAALVEERVLQFNPLVDRARARLRDELRALLHGRRYGDVIVALVMGDQGPISDQDWALFNRTGISHLVSISGLHITMIAAAVALLGGAIWRRHPRLLRTATLPAARAAAAIAGGTAYCLLAGWGVPAQRTLIMLVVVALGQCWRARFEGPVVLAAAAMLVCLWDPWAVLAAGFWLSFGAVACIFWAASGSLAQSPGWAARLREAVRVQGAITIGQVPLTLAIFGQVSVVAPVANALAIPLVSYLVAPLALAGAACTLLPGPGHDLAALALTASEWLFARLAVFLQWLTRPEWSWFCLPLPPSWTLAAAALGCVWLLAPPGWPMRILGAGWMLPMLLWPVPQPAPGELWITALDVGQGMALVLETGEAVAVFDTGPRYTAETDAGGRVVVPYLRARGVRRVDALFVSHADIDHAGGAASLLHGIEVARVWTSVDAGHPLLAGAKSVQRCQAGQRIELGDLRLTVLSPPAQVYGMPRATTNARSCVVLAELGARRALLTGDVPARQERQMLEAGPELRPEQPLDLLVAPHHGSHSSSSPELLAATRPRWVSMQLGYRNRFGHPHAEVVQRYRALGAAIVRSDESGAAQWRLGPGGREELERWRIDHARYWNDRPAAQGSRLEPQSDP
jgi:competence protein ComEC